MERLQHEPFDAYKERLKQNKALLKKKKKGVYATWKDSKGVEHEIKHSTNRRERRSREPREFNNSKSYPLVVRKIGPRNFWKATKFIQTIFCHKTGREKRIVHYRERHRVELQPTV